MAGYRLPWFMERDGGPHEASFLRLDCSRMKSVFGWKPVWNYGEAVQKTAEWMEAYLNKRKVVPVMMQQIREYSSRLQEMCAQKI